MIKRGERLLCLVVAFCVFMNMGSYAWASKIDDLKKKNQEDQEKLDELGEEIDSLTGEREEIVSEMDELEAEIIDMMTSISILEDEIEAKKLEIVQAQKDLEAAKQEEENQYEAMKVRIHFMYERGDTSYLDILLSASSMDDVLNKAEYIERLYDYDRKLLIQYQEARQAVEELKAALEIEQSDLEATQAECEEEKAAMELAFAELEAVSEDYALQISKAKQQAEVYKTQIKQQNAEIARLEEEARKAAEEAARRNNAQKVQGTATVNKEEIMAAKGSDIGKQIAIYACGFVGNPYVWGGTSLTNGTDCSGFTQAVYKAYGYNIPRTSYSQRSAGKEVSYADAQPGDLICYAGHVAMYIGNGRIVHAKSTATGIRIDYATYKQIICVRRIV